MKENNKEKRGLLEELGRRGIECGGKIADILKKEWNEDFDLIIPLYRCAMTVKVIDTSRETDEIEHPGIEIRSFPDPHFWGKEMNLKTIKESESSRIFVRGRRTGLRFFKEISSNEFQKMYTENELKTLGALED